MKQTNVNDKTYMFEQMPIPQAIAKLCIPTILSSLVMVLYNLADTYFVGMLNDPVQNAAVTLAAPILLAFNAVNNLFGVGSSSMMSRALGRKDMDTVTKSSAFGFYCSLFCGLLISVVSILFMSPLLHMLGADVTTYEATRQYMFYTVTLGAAPSILNVVMAYMVRSEGAALHASIGTMSGCFLNMILDPIFILPAGLNLGAAGAGFATCLSNCAACCYFFVLLYKKRDTTCVCINPKKFSLDKRIVSGVCMVGIPASIQNLLNVTGMTILNNMASGFAVDAVASMGIAQKINNIPMQIALGASQGIMPMVSYNYASGNGERMKKTITFYAKLMVPALFAITACYFAFSEQLIRLFMDNESIVVYGSMFLKGMCLGLPFLCIDFLAVGVFQALGLGINSFVFAILRKLVLEIPALFLLNWLFPLYGLPYAQVIAEVILAIAAVIMLRRIFKQVDARAKKYEKTDEMIA